MVVTLPFFWPYKITNVYIFDVEALFYGIKNLFDNNYWRPTYLSISANLISILRNDRKVFKIKPKKCENLNETDITD